MSMSGRSEEKGKEKDISGNDQIAQTDAQSDNQEITPEAPEATVDMQARIHTQELLRSKPPEVRAIVNAAIADYPYIAEVIDKHPNFIDTVASFMEVKQALKADLEKKLGGTIQAKLLPKKSESSSSPDLAGELEYFRSIYNGLSPKYSLEREYGETFILTAEKYYIMSDLLTTLNHPGNVDDRIHAVATKLDSGNADNTYTPKERVIYHYVQESVVRQGGAIVMQETTRKVKEDETPKKVRQEIEAAGGMNIKQVLLSNGKIKFTYKEPRITYDFKIKEIASGENTEKVRQAIVDKGGRITSLETVPVQAGEGYLAKGRQESYLETLNIQRDSGIKKLFRNIVEAFGGHVISQLFKPKSAKVAEKAKVLLSQPAPNEAQKKVDEPTERPSFEKK